MINPDNIVIDIEEQREWLNAHKTETGASWPPLSKFIGIPAGTLSPFATGSYTGNRQRIAEAIFRYRQTLTSQAERSVGLVESSGYFDTRTSSRIMGLFTLAHTGRITLAATSPGTGKSITMREYAASASNVTCVTMRKSTKSVNALALQMLQALGVPVKGGWGAHMASSIVNQLRGRRALLIVDEANHMSLDQFEEVRGWHDESGCGVCFLGNEELEARITTGTRSDAFARLNSRIANRHIQTQPEREDVEAFCDAWGLTDNTMRELLLRIALTPASGGLRECAQIVEQASLIAADEERPLSFADLREAKATRTTKHIN